jgi:glycosyltransferase involved in cell wall biosynthesis
VGGRAGYKGFATLLEAYATWSGREEVSLIAAGRPWTPDEERALHELGVADRVRLVAEPDDRELAELYAAPGVLVQPSEAEGFGLTVLEAMAAGRAVAAARIPPTEEVGGEVPFWFEPGDVEGLHAALDLALAADEDRRAAGRRRAAGFSWDATADATYDVLRSVAP